MRILSGILKFKRVKSIQDKKLRPTSNKVRQALFNVLLSKYDWKSWAHKTHLLDAFAGTGIISLEAFSRNLKEATLFEKEKIIFLTLKSNMLQLNLENKVKLLNNDFFNITLEKKAFNLVYLDPPYHQNLMDMAINKILDEKALKKTSILVCETKKNYQFNKELHKYINLTKTYGKTSLTFFKFY